MARFCGQCGSRLDAATGLCPACDAETLQRVQAWQRQQAGQTQQRSRRQTTQVGAYGGQVRAQAAGGTATPVRTSSGTGNASFDGGRMHWAEEDVQPEAAKRPRTEDTSGDGVALFIAAVVVTILVMIGLSMAGGGNTRTKLWGSWYAAGTSTEYGPSVTFYKDGTCSFGDDDGERGSWQLDDDELTIRDELGIPVRATIVSISDDKLVLSTMGFQTTYYR